MLTNMNLGDPELELIDPTPNVHSLFIHFDKLFFWTKLASRAVVRWSKRMYSCAGICSYDRGGLCDIALSEPLLKLRPRKDLIETLLHEMIHAYLFITNRDRDRDGHGPNFQAHMHRINNAAGLNISIYHDFHDEVRLYQTHWWRCNGPCQALRPHFGIVRRSYNRAPGPSEYWWEDHKRRCGGTFSKIKEPENTRKKAVAKPKSNGDITKYINNPKTNNNVPTKPILKDSNNIPIKMNGGGTIVITKKDPIFNPKPVSKPPMLFSGAGHSVDAHRNRSNSTSVVETVRNVWANKKLPESPNAVNKSKPAGINKSLSVNSSNLKRLTDSPISSPPQKIKKIDDYFNRTSTMLKDIYGKEITVTQKDKKMIAVVTKEDAKPNKIEVIQKPTLMSNDTKPIAYTLVDCPVCSAKVRSHEINKHLDECLNKEVINSIKGEERILSQSPPIKTASITKIPVKDNTNLNNNVPKYLDVGHELSLAIAKVENEIINDSLYKNCNDLNEAKERLMNLKNDQLPTTPHKNIKIKTEKEEPISQGCADINLANKMIKEEIKPKIKLEPGTSTDSVEFVNQMCACCGNEITTSIEEHLEECLAFFTNNDSVPDEGASTSFNNETVVIDDNDDILDESLILNDTGTKSPCPCCLKMIETAEMNEHLDMCLS